MSAKLVESTMNLSRTWTLAIAVVVSITAGGCATVRESLPPKMAAGSQPAVSFSADMPPADLLPELSAVAPGTRYVVVQSGGGSVLLGPVLGSLNIAANTKAMAAQYKDSLLGIDPTPIARDALSKVGLQNASNAAVFMVKPFVFVQHCYDDKFRLSLVLHVDGSGTSQGWVGRYTHHLPTSYPVSRFGSLSVEELANYRAEVAAGAAALADLLQRDLTGKLPAIGRRVNFGSLYLIGNKFGGMGIYKMPEELFFPNAQVVEETDSHVTVRLGGNMHATSLMGGMAFGVHRIDRKLVHTLKPL